MTNGYVIKRKKGKWKRGMYTGFTDYNSYPIRVGDIVKLRYDQLVDYGTWKEVHVDCVVEGCPKGEFPILSLLGSGEIIRRAFDPGVDLEVVSLTQEQEEILYADMEAEMQRLEPELYEV